MSGCDAYSSCQVWRQLLCIHINYPRRWRIEWFLNNSPRAGNDIIHISHVCRTLFLLSPQPLLPCKYPPVAVKFMSTIFCESVNKPDGFHLRHFLVSCTSLDIKEIWSPVPKYTQADNANNDINENLGSEAEQLHSLLSFDPLGFHLCFRFQHLWLFSSGIRGKWVYTPHAIWKYFCSGTYEAENGHWIAMVSF